MNLATYTYKINMGCHGSGHGEQTGVPWGCEKYSVSSQWMRQEGDGVAAVVPARWTGV